jgi:hypothetical protein
MAHTPAVLGWDVAASLADGSARQSPRRATFGLASAAGQRTFLVCETSQGQIP